MTPPPRTSTDMPAQPSRAPNPQSRIPSVFMMDLWATVPYYTAYLSRALLAAGASVQIGSITYYLDRDCFRSRGLRLQPGLLNVVGNFALPRIPRQILKLAETILNMCALTLRFLVSPPGIIHVQYLPLLRSRPPLDWWFVRLWQRRGSKVLLTVHDLLPHDTADVYKAVFVDLYRQVDAIICHSDHISTRLQAEFHVPCEKISVIPHGPFFYDLPVRTSPAAPAETTPSLLVLWQGIIFPYKGLDLLLSAWQQVEAAVPHARLIVAGTGAPDLIAQLRAQVNQLALQHVELNLRFISTEELVDTYRRADIVVYPYRAITTSGALATGLALGKTIVASNLPVFRELLRDRENALLVDPQDRAALAAALIELAQDPDLRHQLSTNVAEMKFGDRSWLSIAEQTITAYKKL